MVVWFIDGLVCYYKIKYLNGIVDVFCGWCSSLGKVILVKEVIICIVKIINIGKLELVEESGSLNIFVIGVMFDKVMVSVVVGNYNV